MTTTNHLLSESEFMQENNRMAIKYIRDKEVELVGTEIRDNNGVICVIEPSFPNWSLVQEWFTNHPEEKTCYYLFNKDEIIEMIRRLEIVKDSMED